LYELRVLVSPSGPGRAKSLGETFWLRSRSPASAKAFAVFEGALLRAAFWALAVQAEKTKTAVIKNKIFFKYLSQSTQRAQRKTKDFWISHLSLRLCAFVRGLLKIKFFVTNGCFIMLLKNFEAGLRLQPKA
jgi:hypothetical protein